jgi:hypothetical protein
MLSISSFVCSKIVLTMSAARFSNGSFRYVMRSQICGKYSERVRRRENGHATRYLLSLLILILLPFQTQAHGERGSGVAVVVGRDFRPSPFFFNRGVFSHGLNPGSFGACSGLRPTTSGIVPPLVQSPAAALCSHAPPFSNAALSSLRRYPMGAASFDSATKFSGTISDVLVDRIGEDEAKISVHHRNGRREAGAPRGVQNSEV